MHLSATSLPSLAIFVYYNNFTWKLWLLVFYLKVNPTELRQRIETKLRHILLCLTVNCLDNTKKRINCLSFSNFHSDSFFYFTRYNLSYFENEYFLKLLLEF